MTDSSTTETGGPQDMTATTDGQRLYAIGDIHGRSDLLTAMLARIRSDLAARPHPAPRLIFLGDYVDRGPDSRGVIEMLIAVQASDMPATFILGNHDSYIEEYFRAPEWYDRSIHWLNPRMGGNATLASYGVPDASEHDPAATVEAFRAAFPDEHMAFLDGCGLQQQIGSYLFVHAGIRPGVRLDRQLREDLIWIREPFLSSTRDFGVKVVHGHTIVEAPEHHPNRIAIDTGAYASNRLTCLVLEDSTVAILSEDGPAPLPLGAGLPEPAQPTARNGLRDLFRRS